MAEEPLDNPSGAPGDAEGGAGGRDDVFPPDYPPLAPGGDGDGSTGPAEDADGAPPGEDALAGGEAGDPRAAPPPGDAASAAAAADASALDSESAFGDVAGPAAPPPPPRGTPLRVPAARPARPGILAAVLRAGWEELNYPRARVRAVMRRAANRIRERRLVASLLFGTIAGGTFILYASGVGVTRGFLAWAVFMGAAVGFAVGGPAALIYAWPAAIAAALGACAWAGWALGAGALWLGMATCAAMLALYLAAAEAAPFVAAGGACYLAWRLAASAGGNVRLVGAGVAFAATAAVFMLLRRRTTAPVLAAAWVLVSGSVASHVAWPALGGAVPEGWGVQALPGPPGLMTCLLGIAFGAALFSWPRRREVLAGQV